MKLSVVSGYFGIYNFTRSPIGKNTLRNVSLSWRATSCSVALGKGVPEKLINDRTGHRDVKSLHGYQRESGREREAVF